MTTDDLQARIEALFASATHENVRRVARQLETLVRQVEDPVTRRRYESAIDQLPAMVAHESVDEG